jgi:guanine deaminase
MTDEAVWVRRAVELATENVTRNGGPFGALVVRGDEVLGRGGNRVTSDLDPTAHAEVVAIREACRTSGDFQLGGATLYTSCEPCPLCLSAALWSRVDGVVWAADRHAAARAGFDDAHFHELLATLPPGPRWPLRLEHLPVDTDEAPFDAWRATGSKVPY